MVLKSIIMAWAIVFVGLSLAPSLYKTNRKRTDKVLAKHWPDEEYSLTRISQEIAGQQEIYKVDRGAGKQLAYVLFAEATSKVETFTYLIVFDPDGVIEKVAVLLYKENYGGEIASKRFLRQFEGKSNGQAMKYKEDIDGISGATISVQSIALSIKKNSIAFSNLIKQL